MSDPVPPKWQDLPETALCLLVCGSFFGVGTDNLMKGEVVRAIVSYLVGTAFFAVGISWHWLKPMLAPKVVATVTGVTSDFRWWMAIALVIFLYVGYPSFVDAIRSSQMGILIQQVDTLFKERAEAQRKRRLTDDQKNIIRSGICGSPEDFKGLLVRSVRTPEGLAFAEDITEILRECKVELEKYGDTDPNPHGIDTVGDNYHGLFVEVKDSKNPNKGSRRLFDTLKRAGLPVEYSETSGLRSEPWLFVGYK